MSSASQPLVVPRAGLASLIADYATLTKARVTTLIVMTAWAGAFFAAEKSGTSLLSWALLHALVGIGLVSGGTAAINEVVERDLVLEVVRPRLGPRGVVGEVRERLVVELEQPVRAVREDDAGARVVVRIAAGRAGAVRPARTTDVTVRVRPAARVPGPVDPGRRELVADRRVRRRARAATADRAARRAARGSAMRRGFLFAGAALALTSAMALAAPESLLPGQYDDPSPAPAPPVATPAAAELMAASAPVADRAVPFALPAGVAPENRLQVHTIRVARAISVLFPEIKTIGGYRQDPLKWHPNGLAIDVMIPKPDTPEGIELGNQIAGYALANTKRWGVDHVIWRQRIYPGIGTPSWTANYGSETLNHYDHVHIATDGGGYPTGHETYYIGSMSPTPPD